MQLTEFKAEHLLMLEMQNTLDTELINKDEILEEGRKKEGKSFTLTNDGTIVGCGGVKHLWDGVYEAWAIPSVHVVNNKRDAIVACQKGLKNILDDDPSIKRIHALVLSGFDAGTRMAVYLGFICEGILRKYGTKGEDYRMFSIVR